DDRVVTLDATSAEVLGTVQLRDAGDMAPAGTAPVLVATPDAVEDRAAAARAIAGILGGNAATYEERLRSTADRTVLAPIANADQRAKVQKASEHGELPWGT